MKKSCFFLFGLVLCFISESLLAQNSYTLVVEGFDWGPAVNKVVLAKADADLSTDAADYRVNATRSTALSEGPLSPAEGERMVLSAYASDARGNRMAGGDFITLNLAVGPNMAISNPFQYLGGQGNVWVDYKLSITNTKTLAVWNEEADRIMPLIDEYDLSGNFASNGVDLTYASYSPESDLEKKPLIIWLHGGGEGGTDTTVPLLANRAANYAAPEIQDYFGGAYVLVPQAPTYWMDSGNGYARGDVDDIYYKALKVLIEDYVSNHTDIDTDRIYIGGCSNGGYMSLKLILEYPDYFAAGYISALAYGGEFFTQEKAKSIRKTPIWFVHAQDDNTTRADQTVIPVYNTLMDAGANDVHLSLYDHVVDITGLFGGDDFHYPGHFSWIYSHANKAQRGFDGSPVMIEGMPVTIMQWLAAQSR